MRRRVCAALVAGLALAACGGEAEPPTDTTADTRAAGPAFVDVSAEWGLDFVHDAGRTPEKHLPETMGAGAALLDVDTDGDLDLYLLQGGPLPLPGRPAPAERPVNRLYRNAGDGRLVDATAESGAAAHPGYAMGVCQGDVDGDGHVDLYVTNLGPDVLLRGDGRGAFADATAAAGLGDERWTAGCVLFDPDADGDLDLYVAGYLEVDLADPEWCGRREEGWRTVCHPDRYPGLADRFWRNRGDGTFADETHAAGFAGATGKGLGVVASDLDGDGWLDVYVANDSVENHHFTNRGDGTFVDDTLLAGTGVNAYGATEAGMGVAAGDVDGNGAMDLFVTNFDHESHTLYLGEGGGTFVDATARSGLEAATRLPVGFGALMADLDHDADLDLAVANGHIVDVIHLYDDAQTWAQPGQLFWNDGSGGFADAGARTGALAQPRVGRALVCGDLDGDGDLDLVVSECGGPARVLRNEHTGAPAVVIEGLTRGARVELALSDGRRVVREAGPQPSYFGQTAPGLHLGLGGPDGPATVVELAVREPGGGTAWTLAPDPPLAGGRWELRAAGDGARELVRRDAPR